MIHIPQSIRAELSLVGADRSDSAYNGSRSPAPHVIASRLLDTLNSMLALEFSDWILHTIDGRPCASCRTGLHYLLRHLTASNQSNEDASISLPQGASCPPSGC